VALTRARDLLLLPRQTDRASNDWFSLLDLDLDDLPAFDAGRWDGAPPLGTAGVGNAQDQAAWQREAAAIVAGARSIVWHRPSMHEGEAPPSEEAPVFSGAEAVAEWQPSAVAIQGGRERGLILHKLIEEVLTGETANTGDALKGRAAELIGQMGLIDEADPAVGPSSAELAATALRGLGLPEIIALRPRLRPEVPIYGAAGAGQSMTLTSGIADAVAIDDSGRIDIVVDWKSGVAPDAGQVDQYRQQVRDYLDATGAAQGLIVFLTTGRIEVVKGNGPA